MSHAYLVRMYITSPRLMNHHDLRAVEAHLDMAMQESRAPMPTGGVVTSIESGAACPCCDEFDSVCPCSWDVAGRRCLTHDREVAP